MSGESEGILEGQQAPELQEAYDLSAIEGCIRIAEMHRGKADPIICMGREALNRLCARHAEKHYGLRNAPPPAGSR